MCIGIMHVTSGLCGGIMEVEIMGILCKICSVIFTSLKSGLSKNLKQKEGNVFLMFLNWFRFW